MLIEFRVENYRSLRDEQALTMAAGRCGDNTDSRPRQIPGHNESLLTVAAIYGANASGKTNVLKALSFMRDAVLFSHRIWAPEEGVPRTPFAWGEKRADRSMFEATFVVHSVRYQYGFVASDESFTEEWLYAWPNGRKQTWFEREEGTPITFGGNLLGENKVIEEVTGPNALFVSAATQHRHPQLQAVSNWFRSLRTMNLQQNRRMFVPVLDGESSLARLFDSDIRDPSTSGAQVAVSEDSRHRLLKRFRDLIRYADVGIVDVKTETREFDDQTARPRKVRRFFMKHQNENADAWLPLEEESRGTQTLFHMALPILQVMDDGGVLIIDELEASLHPALAQQIVRQFNDPAVNHNNAQILFSTHDTNLLGTILGDTTLRRDQVWLTEKDKDGATVLYPLTDFKPRKAENLERGYLQGRYGAVPFLGNFSVAGE